MLNHGMRVLVLLLGAIVTKTYRIDTGGGVAARWLPSIEEAKARVEQSVTEGWEMFGRDDGEPRPVITYEISTETEEGIHVPEYIRVIIDGRWEESISPERPRWPMTDYPHGDSPPLFMEQLPCSMSAECNHRKLMCENIKAEAITGIAGMTSPLITCVSCLRQWIPENQ